MPLKWSSAMATGIRQIDLQHQEFIGIINELEGVCMTSQQAASLDELLSRLRAYVIFHFGTEEALMEKSKEAAAHITMHKAQHLEFARRVNSLHEQPHTADELAAFIAYLQSWLIDHIMHTDRKMAVLLGVAGITAASHTVPLR